MNKRDFEKAWHKVKSNLSFQHDRYTAAIDCLIDNLPDDEPDAVNEHIKHGLEWMAKTAQPKVHEWEKTLVYIVRPGTIVNFEEMKQLFREEMKKLCNDIKSKLLPERYYPDVTQHTRNQMWIDDAIHEALKDRGIK